MSVEAPRDIPASMWRRVLAGERFVGFARLAGSGLPAVVASTDLATAAELVAGRPGVWSDVDRPGRLEGPRMALVLMPDGDGPLAGRLREARAGGGVWELAVAPDLADADVRGAVARSAEEGVLRVVLCDAEDPQVIARLAYTLGERGRATMARAVEAAAARWPLATTG